MGLEAMNMRIFYLMAALPLLAGAVKAQADDSDARPPVSQTDIAIVKRAREILNSPAKWNRADTRQCPPDEKTFSLYCALEKATQEEGTKFEHRGAAMQEARFVIDEIAPHADYEHRLMGYNNDPKTTFADIQKVFALLEARIAERLRTEQNGQSAPAKPASTATDIAILKRVGALLESEAKWDRQSTQKCAPGAATLGLYCAFERASIELTGKFDHDGAALNAVRDEISANAPNRDKYQARLVDYNNDPTVSLADVQKMLQAAEESLVKSAPRK
jgi:hypothetical protein